VQKKSFVVWFLDDGQTSVHPCTLRDGVIYVNGTAYSASIFRSVAVARDLTIYVAGIQHTILSEHQFWDKIRRSLKWSSLTKPQSSLQTIIDSALPALQWAAIMLSAWFSFQAMNSVGQIIAYLEYLK